MEHFCATAAVGQLHGEQQEAEAQHRGELLLLLCLEQVRLFPSTPRLCECIWSWPVGQQGKGWGRTWSLQKRGCSSRSAHPGTSTLATPRSCWLLFTQIKCTIYN